MQLPLPARSASHPRGNADHWRPFARAPTASLPASDLPRTVCGCLRATCANLSEEERPCARECTFAAHSPQTVCSAQCALSHWATHSLRRVIRTRRVTGAPISLARSLSLSLELGARFRRALCHGRPLVGGRHIADIDHYRARLLRGERGVRVRGGGRRLAAARRPLWPAHAGAPKRRPRALTTGKPTGPVRGRNNGRPGGQVANHRASSAATLQRPLAR